MKLLLLLLVAFSVTVVSGLSQAEIYKWKDKDGRVRYSDTPPPSNVKQEPIIGKKKSVAPTAEPALEPQAPAGNTAVAPPANISKDIEPPISQEDAAAELRQRNAEIEKNNKQEKEAEAKRKADNCSAAKANMETYAQGGRVYKMNEKGDREYLDENSFKAGRDKAQQEINENC